MKVRLQSDSPKLSRTDVLVALAFEGKVPAPAPALAAAIKFAHATGDLATGERKTSVFYPDLRNGPKRLVFVGMGARKGLDAERLRRAAAVAQAKAEDLGAGAWQLWLNAEDHHGVDDEVAGRAIAEGLILGGYRYQPPSKTRPKARSGQDVEGIYTGKGRKAFAEGFRVGRIGAQATVFARDLENLPGNICTPRYLAAQARKLAQANLKVKVFDEREMGRLKMGALLGVTRGSGEPARLIVLDYKPAGAKRTVCVVGKGLTFDTGGISIKPARGMDEMRYDMCGGGAVLGLFHALKAGVFGAPFRTRVVGVIAAAENMPDAQAQKPGDVVTACDGTTIEVLNTDAEGRLVLADALAYAKKTYEPQQMVDLATLTGAVVVALGHEAAGVMGTDQKLIDALIEAGKATDEPLWQLPLWEEHREQMKSKFADLGNINNPNHGNGSTAGAAFLSYFVEGTAWAHLDIAGTAYGQRARDYYRSGASGTAVRTLIQWLLAHG